MSTVPDEQSELVPAPPASGGRTEQLQRPGRGLGSRRWLLFVVAAVLVVSIVRASTGADNLTSVGAIESALKGAVPIALAGLAGLWAERAGVVNIGLEGMMVLGSFGCGWAGYQYGPWAGLFAGIVCGTLGGLLLALAAVTFGVDHIVAGIAISIVAPGLTLYLSELLFSGVPGGGFQQSPPVADVYHITIPFLSDWLDTLNRKHWFLVSDLAGLLGGSITQLSILTLIAAVLFAGTGFVLWRTRFGLRLRSVGEAPYAAESLGVDVYRYKYIAVAISGALAGFAGSFLVIGLNYQNGQTGGRGYIGLATVIFGNWRPGGLAVGALLFGYTDGVQQYDSTSAALHAFLAVIAVALVAVGVWQYRAGARGVAVVSVVIAAAALFWFFSVSTLPGALVQTAPYVITLLVMGLASQRLRPPRADGMIYRKGGGG